MTQTLFLCFLALIIAALAAISFRYRPRSTALAILGWLLVWLGYVGTLSYLGVIRNPALRPPGIGYVILPVVLFVFFVPVRSASALRVALAMPLWLLIGFQSFRFGVELLLHRLSSDGLVPCMLTYRGANVDILIGLSAPFVAWLSLKGRACLRLTFAWNVLGLLALANIAARSLLTSPGPMHLLNTEVPNLAFGRFPFTLIPGFFAPLAVVLHVLALRAIRAQLRHGEPSGPAKVKGEVVQTSPGVRR